jgi:hypothetical protein
VSSASTRARSSERVVERLVDGAHADAEAGRRVPVHVDGARETDGRRVAPHVRELGQMRERIDDARRPDAELLRIGVLERVLIRGRARHDVEREVLHR